MSGTNLGTITFNTRKVIGADKFIRFPLHSISELRGTERQDGAIIGTVRNPDSSPVAYCLLTLHMARSGRQIGKVFADASGQFEFTGLNIVSRKYFVVCHDPVASPDYQFLIRSFAT